MDSREVGRLLTEKFPKAIANVEEFRGETSVTIETAALGEIMTFLKQNDDLSYDMLLDLTGVDFPNRIPRFTVSYLLNSTVFHNRLRIKITVAEGSSVDSVSDLWKAANWMEREASEMFGIHFNNHPDLKHILLTDDFVGYPLRKDYDVKGPDFGQPLKINLEQEDQIF
jgi:NADH-quinone oxidoreductase subunit C